MSTCWPFSRRQAGGHGPYGRLSGHNVDFQFEVARRKYTTPLAKELERKEIQEGLIKACNVIDLVD